MRKYYTGAKKNRVDLCAGVEEVLDVLPRGGK